MKKLTLPLLLLSAACATAPTPATAPAATVPQGSTVAEMQVTMTELLERLDVLNDRITRLETAQSEMRSATQAPPASAGARVAAPPTAAAAPATAVATPQSAALRGADIAARYREALTLFAKKQFPDARSAFQEVFDSEPEGDLADNALFWMGETYYSAGDYNNALRFYRRVTADFADQNKAPDALLKTALALEKTGDLALAKTTLQQVAERYPFSTAAAAAKKELERIRF